MRLSKTDECRSIRFVRANMAKVIHAPHHTFVTSNDEPVALVLPLPKAPWRMNMKEQAAWNTTVRRQLYEALVQIEKQNGVHELLARKNRRAVQTPALE